MTINSYNVSNNSRYNSIKKKKRIKLTESD